MNSSGMSEQIVDAATAAAAEGAAASKAKTCSACGTAGDGLKRCTCCKSIMVVHYCNRDCQIKHLKTHRAECEHKKTELMEAEIAQFPDCKEAFAKLRDLAGALGCDVEVRKMKNDEDAQLPDYKKAFTDFVPPPKHECPICMLPMPMGLVHMTYMVCCGKLICSGCCLKSDIVHDQMQKGLWGTDKFNTPSTASPCAFCRQLPPSSESVFFSQCKKRVDMNDAVAMFEIAMCYYERGCLSPKDERKAFELIQRASALGEHRAEAYLARIYKNGGIVKQDRQKCKELLELAANGGNICARNELGLFAMEEGNIEAAVFHYRIAASAGLNGSLENLKKMYADKLISKDELADTIRAFHPAQEELRSEGREILARRDEKHGQCPPATTVVSLGAELIATNQRLRTELIATNQRSLIPHLLSSTTSKEKGDATRKFIDRLKSDPPPTVFVKQARKAFGSGADQHFIDDLARFVVVCQHILKENGGTYSSIRVALYLGTQPNDFLDTYVRHFLELNQCALNRHSVGFFLHRLGHGNRLVDESILMIEQIVTFLQAATAKHAHDGKKEGDDKLRVILLSHGGHDSDVVAKKMFDKPNAERDFLWHVDYDLLGGNSTHAAACYVPWRVIDHQGYYCLDCERKGDNAKFCGLCEE